MNDKEIVRIRLNYSMVWTENHYGNVSACRFSPTDHVSICNSNILKCRVTTFWLDTLLVQRNERMVAVTRLLGDICSSICVEVERLVLCYFIFWIYRLTVSGADWTVGKSVIYRIKFTEKKKKKK